LVSDWSWSEAIGAGIGGGVGAFGAGGRVFGRDANLANALSGLPVSIGTWLGDVLGKAIARTFAAIGNPGDQPPLLPRPPVDAPYPAPIPVPPRR
jgi:hypothetical protein